MTLKNPGLGYSPKMDADCVLALNSCPFEGHNKKGFAKRFALS